MQQAYAAGPEGGAINGAVDVLLPANPKFPIAEKMAETVLSIPVSQVLTDAEVTEIIGALNEFVC